MTVSHDINTPKESHWNKRDLKVVHVWNYTIEDNLKELIGNTYINKIFLFFDSLSLKNSIIKCA